MAPVPRPSPSPQPATLLALLLIAGSAAAATSGAAEIEAAERERRFVEELLGPDRWRRLDAARFRIGLHEHAFTPGLSTNPAVHDEVARILARSVGKIVQKGLQRRFRLYERRDAFRARLRESRGTPERSSGRTGLDVSPRLRLGDRPWLGVKLGLRGDGLRSLTSLRFGSELDGGDPSVKLELKGSARRAFVAFHADHPRRGRTIELQLGLTLRSGPGR